MPQLNRSIQHAAGAAGTAGAALARPRQWWIADAAAGGGLRQRDLALAACHPSGGGRMPWNTSVQAPRAQLRHLPRRPAAPDNRSPQRQALRTLGATSHLVQQTPAGPTPRARAVGRAVEPRQVPFEKRVEVQEVAQRQTPAAASGVVIPRRIGIPKDDELKPWELPRSLVRDAAAPRGRRAADLLPDAEAAAPTQRGLVHNDIVAANDETRQASTRRAPAAARGQLAKVLNAEGDFPNARGTRCGSSATTRT